MTITDEAVAAHAAKQRVSLAIARSQLEYAARPFFLMWRDSHCQVPDRFDTFDEAFAEIQRKWAMIRTRVAKERHNASDLGYRGMNGSYIEGPGIGRLPLGWLLLANNVSSY